MLSDEYPPDKEPTLSYGSENGSIQSINDNDGDLLFELGFEDEYFEKKITYLLGFSSKIDQTISEKSIFDFYLAHQTNPDFYFEPERYAFQTQLFFLLLRYRQQHDLRKVDMFQN